ncbi:MAG: hypothetical protein IT425_08780 [Pirellulales bacterium]|nr:hypothetical protein [Pirellulales bacterium]
MIANACCHGGLVARIGLLASLLALGLGNGATSQAQDRYPDPPQPGSNPFSSPPASARSAITAPPAATTGTNGVANTRTNGGIGVNASAANPPASAPANPPSHLLANPPTSTTGSSYGSAGSGASSGSLPRGSQPIGQPTYGYSNPTATSTMKPSGMMRAMLTPPVGTQLRGQPLSLRDAVAGAHDRADQSQRIEAYWDMCSSVADYYLGLREQEELSRLRNYLQHAGSMWQDSEAELNRRVGTSQRAALAAQMRVVSLMGRGMTMLPLPADFPHCGSYDAHYEEIFHGSGPSEARELAALLPLRYAELKDAAMAVSRAEEWYDRVATSGAGNTDATGGLRALELLALRRRAFVQIARDYNRRIIRYAELATPGQLSPDQLTSMLIRTNATATATRPANSLPPNNRQSQDERMAPPTLVGGEVPVSGQVPVSESNGMRQDTSVRPASGSNLPPRGTTLQRLEPSEHSVLVPSRD